jgi:hypothetical protein
VIGSHLAHYAAEQGRKARAEGKAQYDNPYSFVRQTLEAYAWEEGYKRA